MLIVFAKKQWTAEHVHCFSTTVKHSVQHNFTCKSSSTSSRKVKHPAENLKTLDIMSNVSKSFSQTQNLLYSLVSHAKPTCDDGLSVAVFDDVKDRPLVEGTVYAGLYGLS